MKTILRFLLTIVAFCGMSFVGYRQLAQHTCISLIGYPPCTRILFIGNSHTYTNNLPDLLAKLAWSGGKRIDTGMIAQGGRTLEGHIQDPATMEYAKSEQWDFLILQEQSQIPASKNMRRNMTLPSIRAFQSQKHFQESKIILFAGWGREFGWPEEGLPSYPAMQNALNQGFQELSNNTRLELAPIGRAWQLAMQEDPELRLWVNDGIHPNQAGSYLAACVLYASLFEESPLGLRFTAGLEPERAKQLQSIAQRVALPQKQ